MPRGERKSSKRAPPKPVSSVPASVAHPAPQQPGLFGQMASTAAGVAIGSTVVRTCTYTNTLSAQIDKYFFFVLI